ncbi:SprT-like domain-containing protein [Aurantibacter sp.]|uniref:SprT-like domain-containing protein n=1 Tax=Aurantibacter sp. TaxID=2807103 RepID=UPI0035C80052
MINQLQNYIPEAAFLKVSVLLDYENLVVIVKNERKTTHGDYRRLPNNKHQITVNNNLNSYRFLITLIHEIAHFEAYKKYGKAIKPHGLEWKQTFQHLMLPFINPDIFPNHLLPLLARHFKNPKASSDTDIVLSAALKKYDPPSDSVFVSELALETIFRMPNNRVFKRGLVRRKRIECLEISSGKTYLFHPNAEVEIVA